MVWTTRRNVMQRIRTLRIEMEVWDSRGFNASDKKIELATYELQLAQLNELDPLLSREGALRELAALGTHLKEKVEAGDFPATEAEMELCRAALQRFRVAYMNIANGAEIGDTLRFLRSSAIRLGERWALERIITAVVYGFGPDGGPNENEWCVFEDSIIQRRVRRSMQEQTECLASD